MIDAEGRVLAVIVNQPADYLLITGSHPDTGRGQFADAPNAGVAEMIISLPAEIRFLTNSVGLDPVTGTITMVLVGDGVADGAMRGLKCASATRTTLTTNSRACSARSAAGWRACAAWTCRQPSPGSFGAEVRWVRAVLNHPFHRYPADCARIGPMLSFAPPGSQRRRITPAELPIRYDPTPVGTPSRSAR